MSYSAYRRDRKAAAARKRTKAQLSAFYKPTPVRIRKIGDAMLAASVFAGSAWQFYIEPGSKIGGGILVLGIIGKFITNFFKEDENLDQ